MKDDLNKTMKLDKDDIKARKLTSCSLEWGKGETYQNKRPTLYGHGRYPRSSVLSGQSRRVWLGDWDNEAQARAELKQAGIKFDDMLHGHGTSHIPVAIVTAHLPDHGDD